VPNGFPHFQPTVRHRRPIYLLVSFAVMLVSTLWLYYLTSSRTPFVEEIKNTWRFLAFIYLLITAGSVYVVRRMGAPIAVMILALVWDIAILGWATWCWSGYYAYSVVFPSMRFVWVCGFIPLILSLPFYRSVKVVKNEFRQAAIEVRKSIPRQKRSQDSVEACKLMFELIVASVKKRDGFIAVYSAVSSELSLEHLVVLLGEAGYKVAFPAIIGEGLMRFYSTVGARDIGLQSIDLIADPMGQKTASDLRQLRLVEPFQISVVVVPGVAFDGDGYRMGFGGGFYDRYLPRLRETTRRYGVCFDEQVYRSLPVQSHDQRLDAVVTPTMVYRRKR